MTTELSLQERHELVSVLRELDPTAPREKRRSVRRKTLISLWIQRLVKGQANDLAKVVLVNVSLTGVGILGKSACLIGDKFVVPLRFSEGGGCLVLCEVKNSRRLASGHYKIGGHFIDRVDDPDGDAKIPGDWLCYAK